MQRQHDIWAKYINQPIAPLPLSASIFVLGDEGSGKRTLIDHLVGNTNNEDLFTGNDASQISELQRRANHIYAVDYRYASIVRAPPDDTEELGKLNFYIFNAESPIFQQFVNEETLNSFLIVIVIDLSQPKAVSGSFLKWIRFVNENLIEYVSKTCPRAAEKIRLQQEVFLSRNRQLDVNGQASEPEVSLGFPLLLIGNKCDAADRLSPSLAQCSEYTLRSLALKYGAAVMYVSERNDVNTQRLYDYLSFNLFGREAKNLECCLDGRSLFLPALYPQERSYIDKKLEEAIKSSECIYDNANKNISTAEDEDIEEYQHFITNLAREKPPQASGKITEPGIDASHKEETLTTQKRSNLIKKLLDGFDRPKAG